MSRRAALLGLMALAGCNFAPVYGDAGGPLRGKVAIETPDNLPGYYMRGQLENRLGLSDSPAYVLDVRPSAQSSAAAVRSDGDTVRFNVVGKASWGLRELGTDTLIGSGEVESFVSYAATGSTVATQAAADDAGERLSTALADMIVTRLLALTPQLTP